MFSLTLPKRDERGFTLIELLVVIIIIGILAAIAIPLFLDQRKLAVDASVKSDVRNTATAVQTWLATNPGQVATDATAYTAAGGKVSQSTGDTVGVSVATDGSYLVCGYAGTAAKAYTAASAAYVFDSTTGQFGLGSCTGGIVGGGNPSSSSTPAPTTTTSAPTGVTIASYDFNDGTTQGFSARTSGYTISNATIGGRQALRLTGSGVNGGGYAATPAYNMIRGKSYTVSACVYLVAGDDAYVSNTTSNPTTTKNTWTCLSNTYTVGGTPVGGTVSIQNSLWADVTGTGTGTAYFDDISIVQND